MSEAYLTNWAFGSESNETRNHFHEIALREARIASDQREVETATPARESLLTRLRLAFIGRADTDACNCPA